MILQYNINQFNGAEINSTSPDNSVSSFKERLRATVQDIINKDLEVIWLYLSLAQSKFVSTTINIGFIYHHADEKGVLLVYKLKPDSFIPGYATHYLGAGGIVIDNNNNILVIQEKYHNIKHYKLPGGALDPGENISQAVIREVLEETGIKTEFVSLSSFRHIHEYRYGKSDIYFACRLKPITLNINIDTREISKAIWMPVDQYLNDPETRIFNKTIVQEALKNEGLKLREIENYRPTENSEIMF